MGTAATYWHKQTRDTPLFPALLWSRPEHRSAAGKLLIIGGNLYGFAAPARAYAEASRAGVGTSRVLLPDSLRKTVGIIIQAAQFVPSTPSGSIARRALAELLHESTWADGVLLAGDVGRNAETTIALTSFAAKYAGPLTITGDAADTLLSDPAPTLQRPCTLLCLTMQQLQRLAMATKSTVPITSDIGTAELAAWLHTFTTQHAVMCVVAHAGHTYVAVQGQLSTTPHPKGTNHISLGTAAHAAVWWLQQPGQPFAAISSSVL